jgi:4-hydroxybenzoate polyprenyltransferase
MANRYFSGISSYLSLVKISHTVFSLPFAFIGYFLAISSEDYSFDIYLLILVIVAVFFARNAAMSFNRYLDRHIDKSNPRTSAREIPAKILKPASVLFFTVINSILFIILTYFINELCFYLSFLALFVILGYSYTKRFTCLSHLILGLGLSFSPIGAYLAVTGSFKILPLYFSVVVMFWVAGFDIIYSLQDFDFDRSQKLKSVPAFLGKKISLYLSIMLHIISVIFIVIAGISGNFHFLYWIGAIIFTLLLAHQHTIVKPNDLRRINLAFFTTNGIASIIFAIFVIVDLFFF